MTQRYTGERCLVVDGPHEGQACTLGVYNRLTGTFDVMFEDGRQSSIKSSRLRPVERKQPIQRQFGGWEE